MNKKWYQDYRIVAPVAVALIGLVGTIVGLRGKQGEPTKQDTKPAQLTPAVPAKDTPPPAPPDLVTFPVVVIDDATEDRLTGARVLADEQGVSSETDSQGRCTLAVRPGLKKLRVTVSKKGFKTQNVELTVFDGMDPARIRLQK